MLFLSTTACAQSVDNELLATIDTKRGSIVLQLYFDKAPLTVSNFVGLAEGIFAKENNALQKKGKYFDSLTFHRVVDNFVVQGGDPRGNGSGGPGYSFSDEFHPDLRHSKKGILSMANSGPNTNGSQFFITLSATPHLDNKHSVFGAVKSGIEVLDAIQQGDAIEKLRISAQGKEATQFLDAISWDSFLTQNAAIENERQAKQKERTLEIISAIENETPVLEKTREGIYIRELNPAVGQKVREGDTIATHYELRLYGEDAIIDSSYARGAPLQFQAGAGRVIRGWDIIVQTMSVGQKLRVIIPPELGYGSQGAGAVIPGNSYLDFIVEIISIE
ncbi:RING-type E3 ubiquitin-protein ligase PPIL2-like [Ylistrum balloti]|uniref:RING-type E3 ubiquitin-protein ligase PPIL2-like n=1 Tax=Ylistrum balloti TaxID=509963 RepID=UPI002905C5E4|nr:RING-type E3 ubiquitin-protein ligase PPIL2-like [Ylistrum balloti]